MRLTLAASMVAFAASHQLRNYDDAHVITHLTEETEIFGGTNIFNVKKAMQGDIIGFKLKTGCSHSREAQPISEAEESEEPVTEVEPTPVVSEEMEPTEEEDPRDARCPMTRFPPIDDIINTVFIDADSAECRANFIDLLENYLAEQPEYREDER